MQKKRRIESFYNVRMACASKICSLCILLKFCAFAFSIEKLIMLNFKVHTVVELGNVLVRIKQDLSLKYTRDTNLLSETSTPLECVVLVSVLSLIVEIQEYKPKPLKICYLTFFKLKRFFVLYICGTA